MQTDHRERQRPACSPQRRTARRTPAGFDEAIAWILLNDDTEFLDEDGGDGDDHLSVTASFAADLYRRSDKEVRTALLERRTKMRASGEL